MGPSLAVNDDRFSYSPPHNERLPTVGPNSLVDHVRQFQPGEFKPIDTVVMAHFPHKPRTYPSDQEIGVAHSVERRGGFN